jgi:hypothetical protein
MARAGCYRKNSSAEFADSAIFMLSFERADGSHFPNGIARSGIAVFKLSPSRAHSYSVSQRRKDSLSLFSSSRLRERIAPRSSMKAVSTAQLFQALASERADCSKSNISPEHVMSLFSCSRPPRVHSYRTSRSVTIEFPTHFHALAVESGILR